MLTLRSFAARFARAQDDKQVHEGRSNLRLLAGDPAGVDLENVDLGSIDLENVDLGCMDLGD